MLKKLLYLSIKFSICASVTFSQVKIIFDTDHGGDADDEGGNVWVESDEPTNHAYLVLIKDPEEMADIIYSIKLENMADR